MIIENLSIKKGIQFYEKQEDLLLDHAPEFIHSLNEEEMLAVQCMNDFEYISFCVIDYETVLVFERGDGFVENKYDSMQEFVNVVRELMSDYLE